MRQFVLYAAMAIFMLAVVAGPAVPTAQACPNCKAANETSDALPRAYMYSILFMLSVPATVVTGFGIGFYRLSKQQAAARDEWGFEQPLDDSPDSDQSWS